TAAINNVKEIQEYLLEHRSSFNPEALKWTGELLEKMDKLQETATKFHSQLRALFLQPKPAEENQLLQERLKAAAVYFVSETGTLIQFIQRSPAITDSRLHSKEYNESLRETFAQFAMKKYLLEGFNTVFDIETFYRRKQKFVLPSFMVNAYAGASEKKTDSPHPRLHQELRKLRDSICSRKNLPVYIVAGSSTIDEMARYLPASLAELRKISGFGDAKIEHYGQQFLDIIVTYNKENNLTSLIDEKSPKRERKEKTGEKKPRVDTKAETFRLFKEGRSVAEIAELRSFAHQTIEGHLAYYVEKGDIHIEEVVSREKLLLIEPVIKEYNGGPVTLIRQKLGNEVGFGEIRLAIAWSAFKNANTAG
ncbi:MAG: helix-turn-helix domain-containing protein, partial [Ferruginibacter sp.]|nr:helix-turn-helix domain-containing protein [Chitinophagaceae bacterium]